MNRTTTGWVGSLVLGAVAWSSGAALARPEPETVTPGANDPHGPDWSKLPARAKADALWARVQASAFSHRGMPAMESRGALSKNLFDTKAAAVLSLLRKSFDTKGDVRPPRHKIFHTFGAVAQVELVPVDADGSTGTAGGVGLSGRLAGRTGGDATRGTTAAGATSGAPRRYTGVFQSGARGLVRLSLGAGELFYMPGLALKLLVDGGESLDVLAIPSFAPSKDKELFSPSNAMTNSLQPPSGALEPILELGMRYFRNVAADPLHRPIEHLAARTSDGQAVAQPVAPYALVFRPSQVARETLAIARASNVARDVPQGDDIRTLLGALAPGTVLYEVWACDAKPAMGPTPGAGERLVARLITRSGFVASSFGDRELHFVHTGATVAPGTLERLDRPVATVLTELDGSIGDALRAANRSIKDRLGIGR